MADENQSGAPVADGAAPPPADAPPSNLSPQEQELLAQLPDFLVNTASLGSMEQAAAGDPPAPVVEPVTPDPTVTAAPTGGVPDASAADQTAPDPFVAFVEGQNKFNEGLVKQLGELASALKPQPPAPPPAPPPKRLEDMTDEEAFVYLNDQRTQAAIAAALKPYEEERAAAKAAKEVADQQAAFNGRVQGVVAAAEGVLPELLGERLAKLSPEQKAACVDEILSAQAANAELKDAQGRVVGLSASQAAQLVKNRWATMAQVFGAPAPLPAAKGQPPRAPVGAQPRVGGPGAVSPQPAFTDAAGNQVNIPDAKHIHKNYGGSTDAILNGLADGFRKVQPRQS